MKLLMISGKGARDTAVGRRNAFWNTLEELRLHFERIDVVYHASVDAAPLTPFQNVFFHAGKNIAASGIKLIAEHHHERMTVQEYFPFRNGRVAAAIWRATGITYLLEIHHIPGYPRAATMREYVARVATHWYIARDALHASAVRVVNQHEAPDFLVRAGLSQAKIRYIPSQYIDLAIFRPMQYEKKYDLMFVGRKAANKGLGLFRGAVRMLRARYPAIKELIVDGWAKDSYELAKLYNESKLLIVSSYNEGGPRVMLEALACGTPVVSTRVGLAEELLDPAVLADWHVKDIADRASRVLASPTSDVDRNKLADIARQFEKKSMIKNYAQAITDLH